MMAALLEQPIADCTLQASASLASPTLLRLRYRVQNHTAYPLYLINQFWLPAGPNGSFEVMPNMVNVQLHPDRVTVGKGVVPVPDDKEVEYPYTPHLSRVAPQGWYEETLELAVPLVPFTIYHANRLPTRQPVPRPLYFELGYLTAGLGYDALMQEVATAHGPIYTFDAAPADQRLAVAGPLLPEILVLSAR